MIEGLHESKVQIIIKSKHNSFLDFFIWTLKQYREFRK